MYAHCRSIQFLHRLQNQSINAGTGYVHRVDGDREAVDAVEQREARLHHRPEPVIDADDDHLAAFAVKFHLTETCGTTVVKKNNNKKKQKRKVWRAVGWQRQRRSTISSPFQAYIHYNNTRVHSESNLGDSS